MSKLLKSQLQLIVNSLNLLIQQFPDTPSEPPQLTTFINQALERKRQKEKHEEIQQPELPLEPQSSDEATPMGKSKVNWRKWEDTLLTENNRKKIKLNSYGLSHRTLAACNIRLQRLGIEHYPHKSLGRGGGVLTPNWTIKQDRRLLENWRKDVPLDSGLHPRTPEACRKRLERIEEEYPDGNIPKDNRGGSHRLRGNDWKPEEDKILLANKSKGIPLGTGLSNRTFKAIYNRLRRINLAKQKE